MMVKVTGGRSTRLGLVINIWNIPEEAPAFEVAGLAKATNELGRKGHVVNLTPFVDTDPLALTVEITGYHQDAEAVLKAAEQTADELPFRDAENGE